MLGCGVDGFGNRLVLFSTVMCIGFRVSARLRPESEQCRRRTARFMFTIKFVTVSGIDHVSVSATTSVFETNHDTQHETPPMMRNKCWRSLGGGVTTHVKQSLGDLIWYVV